MDEAPNTSNGVAGRRTLRIAIMCNGLSIKNWQKESIDILLEDRHCICLIINNQSAFKTSNNLLRKIVAPHLFFRLFTRKARQIEELLNTSASAYNAPILDIPTGTEKVHRFSHKQIEQIKTYRPDVILRFGFNILKGDILHAATYGIWSFHHGDEQHFRGGPPAYWEIYKRSSITGAILQKLNEKLDNGHILRKGFFPTIETSYKENLQQILRATIEWPKLAARELMARQEIPGYPSLSSKAPLYTYPRNAQAITTHILVISNKVKAMYKRWFRHEKWVIGTCNTNVEDLLTSQPLSKPVIHQPKKSDVFFADPFFLKMNGLNYIFYEEWSYNAQKAVIKELFSGKTIIDATHHLSYPFIWKEDQRIFMIPEQAASQSTILYELNEDLNVLKSTTILDFGAIDPTLHFDGSKWWLFCTRAPRTNTDLFIFHSSTPHGEWTPHLLNPVKQDIRNSRPAGRMFTHQGSIYRPSQDSERGYGSSVVINRVTTLSPSAYLEEEVAKVRSPFSSYSEGMHHIDVQQNLVVFDMKALKFVPSAFMARLKQKSRRL